MPLKSSRAGIEQIKFRLVPIGWEGGMWYFSCAWHCLCFSTGDATRCPGVGHDLWMLDISAYFRIRL